MFPQFLKTVIQTAVIVLTATTSLCAAELEDELKSLSPEKYFPFVDGSCIGDIRVSFWRHWRNMQGRCNEPCNPCGVTLDQSPALEKEAYEQLKIAKAINFEARLRPHGAR